MYTSEALDHAINDAPEVMIYMMIEVFLLTLGFGLPQVPVKYTVFT